MNERTQGEETLADDIFHMDQYEAPMPLRAKDAFSPWHQPRKQFVRHHQWCHELDILIRAKAPSEGVLKYLGLPGDDLLDLRHLHSVICEPNDIKLRFLGFNFSANPRHPRQTDLNISLDEVKRLDSIDQQSTILGDDFARIANPNSIAFERTRALGPYDVINLDLCGGFGAKDPGSLADNYYNAVSRLLSLQARNANPWLLFLTTRADKPNINADVLQKLIDKYCANLEECNDFKVASSQHFAIETREAVTQAVGQPSGLLHVFLTGLCKWFVTLALQHQPPTSAEVRSVFGYRIDRNAKYEDLVSLAFKFTPTFSAVNDPIGLAAQSSAQLNEGVLATKALRRVAKRVDADQKLNENPALLSQMTDTTARLLELARYDVEKYRVWAAAG